MEGVVVKEKDGYFWSITCLMRIRILSAALFFAFLSTSSAFASSSVNVPFALPLYRNMELWVAKGLIQSNLSSTRPFSRAEVGRLLAEALDKCDALKEPTTACSDLQGPTAKYFEEEVSEVRSRGSSPSTFLKPIDALSITYNRLSGPFSIYNNEGINYYDGNNASVQFQSRGRLWNVFSFFIQPIFSYYQKFDQIEGNDEDELRMHKGYVKLTAGNFEVEVGRDSLWWGPGYHGALLMSNNAHPFDMVKLSNPEPTLLPWIFHWLGPFKFNLFFSELNDGRSGSNVAHPYLYGLRLNFKPHPFFEAGLSHLALFGGSGRDLSFFDVIKILYSNKNRDNTKFESNQELAVDVALMIPNIRKLIFLADSVKLYAEGGAEDTGTLPDRRAYLVGMALYNPFAVEKVVFRVEYADLSPGSVPAAWYSHGSYPMQYDGRVFGHHAGSDADDIFFEWSQDIEKFFYKLGLDRERSGIQTKADVQEKNQYFGEMGYRIKDNSNITVRYSYEEITNYMNVKDDDKRNHFLEVEAALYF